MHIPLSRLTPPNRPLLTQPSDLIITDGFKNQHSGTMCAMNQIRTIARALKREIKVYQLVLKDKRTPLLGKVFLGMAVGYFFLPFDIVPDFIPILGHLDDAIIIPALIFIALRLIPPSIITEYREKVMHD